MNINTIAELKRQMIVGTRWNATNQFHDVDNIIDMGDRECALHNSVGFGFAVPKSGEISHCAWPKKAELVTHPGGFKIVTDYCILTYTLIED